MRFLRNIRTFESLAVRDYRYLWLGQLTTSMGQWMDQVSRTWLVYDLTHSPMQLGLISATRGAPMLLFGIAAGVAADRYGRKPQLIIAQVVNALLNAILATLVITHHVQLWQVYVTAFLAGTVQAFQQPARQVMVNDLVGPEYLPNAIALNSAAINMSRSVGPAIGGILIDIVGVGWSYYVQAAFYAFATVWTAKIRIPKAVTEYLHSAKATEGSFLDSARQGFQYIRAHRLIFALMVLALVPAVLAQPYISLMPIFAGGVGHVQGLLMTMVGIGGIIGAFGIASVRSIQGNGKVLIVGAVTFGLALVLFSRSPVIAMSMIFVMIAGISQAGYNAQNQTVLQLLIPGEYRGRVLGIYLLNRSLTPIGGLLAGFLAELLGAPWAVTVMGASCVVLALTIAFVVPEIWKVDAMHQHRVVTPSPEAR